MRRVDLATATRPELAEFCSLASLEFAPRSNAHALRALILASGHDLDYIEIMDPEPEVSPAVPRAAAAGKARIRIEDPMGNGGRVKVSHNGNMIEIPLGEEVEISAHHLHALRLARQYVYAESDSGLGEPREVYSHPFSVLRE